VAKLDAAKEGQYVVVHDQVSFRDPQDWDRGASLRREEFTFLNAARGEELPEGVSGREVKTLLDFGAIAEKDSNEAKLAKQGLPPVSSLRTVPNVNTVPFGQTENERVQVMKAAMSGVPGPENAQSSRAELMRLPGDHLAIMAKVLGVTVDEKATKQDIVDAIVGGGENATSQSEIDEQRQGRDERQIAARDFGGEAGLLGTDVTSAGRKSSGGKTSAEKASEKASSKSDSGSKASKDS
jgi:hypothetical protein